MSSPAQLPDDLVTWIEQVAGGRLARADRQPGGARKEAWFVGVTRPDGTVDDLFLRYDRSDPTRTGDPWTLHREATVYVALQATDVPVPRVLAVHPEREAMLMARVDGRNWFSQIVDADERTRTAQDFVAHLAALHRIDPARLDLPAFPAPTTVAAAVRHELDELDGVIAQRGGTPDPALAFALDWLRRNIPSYDGPPVLVQGDTGPGNFMYADGRVVAIVDWELAHLGDPMDDIAWLSLRATQEPFPDLPQRLREYSDCSGHAIDPARVHYYRVMAETKLQVMAYRGDRTDAGGRGASAAVDTGSRLIYGVLHRRLWLEALGAAIGHRARARSRIAPASPPRDHESAVRGSARPAPRRDRAAHGGLARDHARPKGSRRVVKYLEQVDAHGAFYEAR